VILADTGIWADHLRASESTLVELLTRGMILMHWFVIGELALGTLRDRDATIAELSSLPRCVRVSDEAVIAAIDANQWMGQGIGWVDATLLVSVRATSGAALWTADRRLAMVARDLGVAVA